MTRPNTRRFFIASLAAAAATSLPVQAQTSYPDRPITLVVPWDAGGPTDVTARELGVRLSARLGQPVVIENRPGAGSRIGANLVARAKPDGYTLMFTSGSSLTSQPALIKSLPYDVVEDFIGIAKVNHAPQVLVVNPTAPMNNLKEFLEYARKNPGELSVASPGMGSAIHLLLEIFQAEAKIKLNHVPFTGSARAVPAVLGNHVMAYMDAPQSILPHLASGKLRALAVTTPTRFQALGPVPTMAEMGLPGVTAASWLGLFVPKGTPADIVTKLSKVTAEAAQEPSFQSSLVKIGYEAAFQDGDAFRRYIRDQVAHYQRAAKIAGIEPTDR